MRNRFLGGVSLWSMIARAPEGEGGAAPAASADAAAAAAAKPAESVLFPDENKPADDKAAGADPAKKEGDDAKPADPAGADWKEYVADPAKSEAENAAAKTEHDKTKPAVDDPADKVPDDGKYTLAMPEGIPVDQELLDGLGPDFKELGLTNKQAQKLADKFITTQQARLAKQGETWANTVQQWVTDAKADKDIGGVKWDATVKTSRRAVDTLGTPALKEYLEATGGGNHPELIRFMAKVGSMIKEDNPALGGAEGHGKPVEAAHVLFPSDAPKGT